MKLSEEYEAVKHNKNVSISSYEVEAETEKEIKEFMTRIQEQLVLIYN